MWLLILLITAFIYRWYPNQKWFLHHCILKLHSQPNLPSSFPAASRSQSFFSMELSVPTNPMNTSKSKTSTLVPYKLKGGPCETLPNMFTSFLISSWHQTRLAGSTPIRTIPNFVASITKADRQSGTIQETQLTSKILPEN